MKKIEQKVDEEKISKKEEAGEKEERGRHRSMQKERK